MDAGISYEDAVSLTKEHVKDPLNWNHLRESEVVMRALARRLGEDEELWGITGLLHDIDWEECAGDVNRHCVDCVPILKEAGVSDVVIDAIVAHAYGTECGGGKYKDMKRTEKLHHALAAGETVTGLIYAYGLMRPDKKLEGAKVKSLKKKFKGKSFAAKVNRDFIRECEDIGLELGEFLEIALNAMKGIAEEIGL